LADSACSHHIPSLAPAVALPAPRHDRRRTGAAGSPPGGFPFWNSRRAGVKSVVDRVSRAQQRETKWSGAPLIRDRHGLGARVSRYRRRTKLRSFPRTRESRLGSDGVPAFAGTNGGENLGAHPHVRATSLDSGNSLCYRTQPLRGPTAAAFRAHSSVGRAADS